MTPPYSLEAAYVLPLRFALTSPALFARASGSSSVQETFPYVPGAALLGACGQSWILANGLARPAENETFRELFLDGGLRFLNAYPEHSGGRDGQRLLPVPRSIRALKRARPRVARDVGLAGGPELRDLVTWPPTDDEQLERAGSEATFCELDGDRLRSAATALRGAYHIQRSDSLRDRPDLQGRELFNYEAIEAGQTFVSAVLGSPENLASLAKHLRSGAQLRMGRSASAEYGGQPVFLDLAEPEAFLSECPERPDRVLPEAPEPGPEDRRRRLVVMLTAPLLAADQDGAPTLEFPRLELAAVLVRAGLLSGRNETNGLTLVAAFQASETVGGFSSVWRLPRPQWQAIAAGSVFVFELEVPVGSGVELDETTVAKIEWESLGLRTAEGFGRFAIGLHGEQPELQWWRIEAPEPPKPVTACKDFEDLIGRISRRARLELVRELGEEAAGRFQGRPDEQPKRAPVREPDQQDAKRRRPPISGALAGRLLELARRLDERPDSFVAFQAAIEALRETARRQLERARHEGTTLLEHLKMVATLPEPAAPGEAAEQATDENQEPGEGRDERAPATKKRAWELPGEKVADLVRLEETRGRQPQQHPSRLERRVYLLTLAAALGRLARQPEEERP